jgi:hypothetical protein
MTGSESEVFRNPGEALVRPTIRSESRGRLSTSWGCRITLDAPTTPRPEVLRQKIPEICCAAN